MNNLQVFKNQDFSIEALSINNEPWFVGKDIANILGYKNSRDALSKHVDDEDKGVTKRDTLGGSQQVTIINESGLYSLILSSKLENAKKFKRWVTSEVLPAIRKTGTYNLPKNYKEALASLLTQVELNEKLQLDNLVKEQQILEMQAKTDYLDNILQNKSLVTPTQIAKDYGMSGSKFNSILNKLKVQYKQSGQWLLYSKYQSLGYTQSETVEIPNNKLVMHTKWTQKGRLFLYELLKKNGYLPIIEQ